MKKLAVLIAALVGIIAMFAILPASAASAGSTPAPTWSVSGGPPVYSPTPVPTWTAIPQPPIVYCPTGTHLVGHKCVKNTVTVARAKLPAELAHTGGVPWKLVDFAFMFVVLGAAIILYNARTARKH